jgi:hypothetical protein
MAWGGGLNFALEDYFDRVTQIPEGRIIRGVLNQAYRDVERHGGRRFDDALRFFQSRRLETLCEWLRLEAGLIREEVNRLVAKRFGERAQHEHAQGSDEIASLAR